MASVIGINVELYKMVIRFKRNLPIDELSKVQIAQGLKMLGVSDETVLKILPKSIINDPEAEAEKMKEVEAEQSTRFNDMLNGE